MPGTKYAGNTKEVEEFPTILLVDIHAGWCGEVVSRLEEDKYHILRAQSRDEALDFAKTHSRPIHVLLAEDSGEGHALVDALKPYRAQMQIVFVSDQTSRTSSEALEPESAAAKVRELLRLPKIRASKP